MFSGYRKWNDPLRGCILLSAELFLHLESGMTRTREEENIVRGGTEEDARGFEKKGSWRKRPLAIKHGVSPALRIMPRNADNWLNRPDDPRRRAHRCSWRHGTARSSARCLIDSKWFILSAVLLHLQHSPGTEATIKIQSDGLSFGNGKCCKMWNWMAFLNNTFVTNCISVKTFCL